MLRGRGLLPNALAWAIPAAGIALRLSGYLSRRSLWFDEALLAKNVIDLGPLELLGVLPNRQVAPPLFLLLADLGTLVFGIGELSLRLLPLVASVASVLIFALLARRTLGLLWAQVAMFCFAFSEWLVYYAQEFKQYATDVFVALALLQLFVRVVESPSHRAFALLVAAGVIAPWMSHPAVFVLAAIGATLLVETLRRRTSLRLGTLALAGSVWLGSFALEWVLLLARVHATGSLLDFWSEGFLPMPTSALALGLWQDGWLAFLSFAGFPGGWAYLAGVLLALGVAAFARERSAVGLAIVLVFAFTLLASTLQGYPFSRRLVLFLVPFAYLTAVRGLRSIGGAGMPSVAVVLAGLLLVPIARTATTSIGSPPEREEVRPLLEVLEQRKRAGDRVHVYHGAAHAVRYYERLLDLDTGDWHFGSRSRPHGFDVGEVLGSRRVWFLFSHVRDHDERTYATLLPGRVLELYEEEGAFLVLYQFGTTQQFPRF